MKTTKEQRIMKEVEAFIMFNTLTRLSVSLVQRYLPSPFVFSALLTLAVLIAGILSTDQSLPRMVQHWSGGFWTLLGFAMQMALIFVTGHALASAPIVNRQLDRLAGSIPLSMASGGPDLARMTAGVLTTPVSITESLFSPLNLTIVALLVIGLPLLNRAMHPRQDAKVADPAKLVETRAAQPARETPAQRLDDSRILGLALVALAAIYLFNHFSSKGFVLGLDVVIAIFLFCGLLLHGTPERYMRAVDESVRGIGGIVLLFPFYAGIMGMMMGANAEGISLGRQITEAFISWSSADTFPLLAFLSAGVVNVFVPSGGGQWAVQGPIMLPAAQALGVSPTVTAMAIAWGDAWTNMIQPFWALPLLGIVGLGARDIMGYCLMMLLYSGVVICGAFYFLT